MKKYRVYFWAAFIASTVIFYLAYQFDIMTEEQFLWPTVICTPLFALALLSIPGGNNFKRSPVYDEEKSKAVQKSASTPLKIIQSPILWLGILSVAVLVWAFSQ